MFQTIVGAFLLLFYCGCAKTAVSRVEQFKRLRIYQVMVEAFIDGDPERNYGVGYGTSHHNGDLRGVIQALPYIKALGMNAIWLTPIFDSAAADGAKRQLDATGYYCQDYFRIDPNFGTLEDARALVQEAHKLGLYVFFDGVFGHHKGAVKPSPTGRLPVGPPDHVSYPESLAFYKEVATYWIDELEIDGWRVDQAYQVPIAAWQEIRAAVEETCRRRKRAGKTWGTLGYMVAEVWRVADDISKQAYGTVEQPGLLSAFDFPMRYKLLQVLAVEEKGFGRQPASVLAEAFESHKRYPPFAIPNLMLTNHDLVRFGDLIERAGFGGRDTAQYWRRHKAAFSFMAAYSGPITFYYGDEIGAEVPGFAQQVEHECWLVGLCDDHVSRSSGKIAHFDSAEVDLINYVKSLMRLREEHPALWRGERENLIAGETIYADLKSAASERILYVLNTATEPATVRLPRRALDAQLLIRLLQEKRIRAVAGEFAMPVPALSGAFFLVE